MQRGKVQGPEPREVERLSRRGPAGTITVPLTLLAFSVPLLFLDPRKPNIFYLSFISSSLRIASFSFFFFLVSIAFDLFEFNPRRSKLVFSSREGGRGPSITSLYIVLLARTDSTSPFRVHEIFAPW